MTWQVSHLTEPLHMRLGIALDIACSLQRENRTSVHGARPVTWVAIKRVRFLFGFSLSCYVQLIFFGCKILFMSNSYRWAWLVKVRESKSNNIAHSSLCMVYKSCLKSRHCTSKISFSSEKWKIHRPYWQLRWDKAILNRGRWSLIN